MKSFLLASMFFLVSCGSSVDKLADAISASNATPTPTPWWQAIATATPAPTATPKAEPTSSPTAAPKTLDDMMKDYKKISNGMSLQQVLQILGTPHKETDVVNCSNGECTTHHWCYWYYGDNRISVRFLKGTADYTTAW
jgi:hypothetical protein